jgi:uncharacterized hydrophobic protein (TIGR00271 family)
MEQLSDKILDRLFRFEGEDGRRYWRQFAAILAVASLISTVGLFRDSGAVVIAAMLIAPLMSPILGIAAAVITGHLARTLYLIGVLSLATLGVAAVGYGFLLLLDVPRGMTLPDQVLSRTDPGLGELMVALAAGIAGAFVQIKREEVSLVPGVAIGVSLVPPLSAAGMLLYFERTAAAWEAMLLYLTNLSAIVLSACVVFWLLGVRTRYVEMRLIASFGLQLALTLGAVAIIALNLGAATLDRVEEASDEAAAANAIREWAGEHSVEILRLDVQRRTGGKTLEIWLMVDVPLAKARELVPVAESVPEDLQGDRLQSVLKGALGPDTIVNLRASIRYSGVMDLDANVRQIDAPAPAPKSKAE